jgi:alkaline phosphatase D
MHRLFMSATLVLAASSALFSQSNVPVLPQAPGTQRIGIIGCHSQGYEAPAIPYMADVLRPQYVLWVGDNVYADTETDPEHIRRQLELMAAKPGFAQLRATSEFLVTWDDHDFGTNDGGADYPLREESQAIHTDFWQLTDYIPAGQEGVYYAQTLRSETGKRVQVILLDGRYHRGNPRKRKADVLGQAQWTWLEQQLQQPADLRLLVNGYQFLLQRPNRWEAWIKVGNSRKRLFDLMRSAEGNAPMLFISGDQHYVEVLESARKVPYHTFEIMAAGINQTERPGLARNRVAGPDLTLHNAPILDIYWSDDPYLLFRNVEVPSGQVTLEYRIRLADIGWKP